MMRVLIVRSFNYLYLYNKSKAIKSTWSREVQYLYFYLMQVVPRLNIPVLVNVRGIMETK